MTLPIEEQTALQHLIKQAKPLSGTYFRSVERRFMDPTEILNGRGTELYGGRFAPIGMKGVYLAETDSLSSAEVLARKKRLGGAAQISLDKYPRVIYAVDVLFDRVVKLDRKPRNPVLVSIWTKSQTPDIHYSQEVGLFLAAAGIQALLFKSTVSKGRNVLVFLNNCDSRQLKIRQLNETLEMFKRIAKV